MPSSVATLDHTTQFCAIVGFRAETANDDADRVDGTVSAFAAACRLGMLGGAAFPPELAAAPTVRKLMRDAEWYYEVDARHVDPANARVLHGMLRADPFVARVIETCDVTVSHGQLPRLVRRTSEWRAMPLPALYEPLGFPVMRHEVARARANRLVRVRFRSPVPDEYVPSLQDVQRIWQRLCAGGVAIGADDPRESSILAAVGYLVAPRTYEIPIQAFDVPEDAFDSLLNALRRCSVNDRQIERVQIW